MGLGKGGTNKIQKLLSPCVLLVANLASRDVCV